MFSAISVCPFLFQIGRHSGKWIAGEEVKEKYCGVDPKRRVGSGVSVCLNNLLACFQHFHDTDEDDGEVVLMIRVNRLIAGGSKRRSDWG